MQVLSKIAKIRDVKMLKTIPLPAKTMRKPNIKPQRRFSDPWGWKTLNNDKKRKKIEKKLQIM